MKNLPVENSKRFLAVLNKKITVGQAMNALGHMAAGLGGGAQEDFCLLKYKDQNGGLHPNISYFPFIVLKADNSNQVRKVRQQALAREIPFTDFTSTMTVGTSQQQQDATQKTPESELEYYGICMFGDTEEIKEFTKKFSLYK